MKKRSGAALAIVNGREQLGVIDELRLVEQLAMDGPGEE